MKFDSKPDATWKDRGLNGLLAELLVDIKSNCEVVQTVNSQACTLSSRRCFIVLFLILMMQ